MTDEQQGGVRDCADHAACIAAIAGMMSETLHADPDTVHIGDAVEGLRKLAVRLSRDLCQLADPE